MKKLLPLIILLVGVLVLVGAFLLSRKGAGNNNPGFEDEQVPEIPLSERPFVTLTPTEDGHWLNLVIDKIVISAYSLDYELLYKTGSGNVQGVPGTVKLEGKGTIERELLLGSESSGKFRYDEGVESGTLTLRFRSDKGKLLGKLSTQFNLQNDTDELSSADGNFKFELSRIDEGFFVVMETFGLPGVFSGEISAGPYGIFSSSTDASGSVESEGKVFTYSGSSWKEVSGATSIGVFLTSK